MVLWLLILLKDGVEMFLITNKELRILLVIDVVLNLVFSLSTGLLALSFDFSAQTGHFFIAWPMTIFASIIIFTLGLWLVFAKYNLINNIENDNI